MVTNPASSGELWCRTLLTISRSWFLFDHQFGRYLPRLSGPGGASQEVMGVVRLRLHGRRPVQAMAHRDKFQPSLRLQHQGGDSNSTKKCLGLALTRWPRLHSHVSCRSRVRGLNSRCCCELEHIHCHFEKNTSQAALQLEGLNMWTDQAQGTN